MKRPARAWTLTFVLFGCLSTTSAQPIDYAFERLTTAGGLSQSNVYAIVQDHEGYMWFGTRDGLNRYDGYAFTVYRHDIGDSTSLSDNIIRTLYEDRAGTVWVGTANGGLNRFDRRTETFTRYRHDKDDANSLSHDDVRALTQTADGALWVGTKEGGLNRMDPRTGVFTRYRHDPQDSTSLPGDYVVALHEDSNRTFWVGASAHGKGLRIMDPTTGTFHRYLNNHSLPSQDLVSHAESIYEGGEGMLWFLMRDPLSRVNLLVRYDHPTGRFTSFPIDRAPNVLTAIAEDEQGYLWLGTNLKGLYRFDKEDGTVVNVPLAPNHPTPLEVPALYYDRSGTLWVGTNEGVYYVRPTPSPFRVYRHDPANPNSLSSNRVNGILVDRDSILWIATSDGLNRLDRRTGRYTRYQHDPADPQSLPKDLKVWSLYEDRKGVLWVGTAGGGLWRMDRAAERFEAVTIRPGGLDEPIGGRDRIAHIREDWKGRLWVSTFDGLVRLDADLGRVVHYFNAPPDVRPEGSNEVHVVEEDHAGILWVGTQEELARLDLTTGHVRRYRQDPEGHPDSLSHDIIWTIHEDREGRLWVGTIGGGLNRLDRATGRFKHYTTRDGLPNDVVYGILEDDDGYLWLSTNNGLARFDPATETVAHYDAGDGLPGNEFDLMAYHKRDTGELFFGGPHGVVSFFPRDLTESDYAPPVALTGFKKLDTPVPGLLADGAEIVLDRKENFFTFTFAAFDYANPPKNRYRYRLEGVDPDWRTTDGSDPKASYTSVPPGDYTFVVEGSNHHGVFGEQRATVRVRIVPAFWQTGWFRTVLLLLVVGLAAGVPYDVNRRRLRRLLRKQEEEREVQRRLAEGRDRERVRIAHDLHDGPMQNLYTVGLHLDALAGPPSGVPDPAALDAVQQELEHVADELRDVCSALRPPTLAHFGLDAALGDLAQRFEAGHPGIQVRLDLRPADPPLPEQTTYALYRICQEALQNIAQHAQARAVSIRLAPTPDWVYLDVEDDGCGFAMPKHTVDLVRRKHYGLAGMIERAEALGGTLRIDTRPGGGARLRVTVPVALNGSATETPPR